MTASTRGKPYAAARITDCGVPPTAIQAGRPASVRGKTCCSSRGGRTLPRQVSGCSCCRCAKRSSFSWKSTS